MDDANIALSAQEFVVRFLPPVVDRGHSLLYGSGERRAPTFVPSQEMLQRCLQEYAELVALAAGEHTFLMLQFDLMDASELVIAFLSRGKEAGVTVPKQQQLANLIRQNEPELRLFVESAHGSGHDALNRLVTIAEMLGVQDRE